MFLKRDFQTSCFKDNRRSLENARKRIGDKVVEIVGQHPTSWVYRELYCRFCRLIQTRENMTSEGRK